jgi:DNA mismatch endonuclease (patch repair protein)
MHACQRKRRPPVRNASYWEAKREGNAARDRKNLRRLRRLGWEVLTVWECQTRDTDKLIEALREFLASK